MDEQAVGEHHWLTDVGETAESWTVERVLAWAFDCFGGRIAVASAFGPEGMVLIDLATRLRPDVRIFTLDTGLFFPETYALIEEVERRYNLTVERVRPALSVEDQAARYGASLWQHDPDRCCQMRKVEPLRRKLSTLEAWITAIRRDQTQERADARKVEWDARFGLVKVNPLCDWTSDMVWEQIRANDIPYNALHDRGYPSIGCAPCTRPVQIGDGERAGRWAGLTKTECGLHNRPPEDESPHVPG